MVSSLCCVDMFTSAEQKFIQHHRVGRLATADAAGVPHVIPVCFVCAANNIYITVDEKPKTSAPKTLKRLRNIAENTNVAMVVDEYDEDWSRLAWVLLRGHAKILANGNEHTLAQKLLRGRYPQMLEMKLKSLPVIAVRLTKVTSWGNLNT